MGHMATLALQVVTILCSHTHGPAQTYQGMGLPTGIDCQLYPGCCAGGRHLPRPHARRPMGHFGPWGAGARGGCARVQLRRGVAPRVPSGRWAAGHGYWAVGPALFNGKARRARAGLLTATAWSCGAAAVLLVVVMASEAARYGQVVTRVAFMLGL